MKTSTIPPGRLDWRSLLQGLQADGVVSAEEAARVRSRFGAGDSSQHPLLRLGNANLVDARPAAKGRTLDVESLTEWLAGHMGLAYLRIDPLKVDAGRVADVMSVAYAESRRALPVSVALTEVTVATCEPADVAWVREIEAHTRKRLRLVVANPNDIAKYTTEFYTLARSVKAAAKTGEASALASFEQLVELGRPTSSSTPTTRAWCRWWTGCGSTPSTSAPATSTSSRGARWAPSAFASTACCTPSTRCR
jgi:general secretion pathway protein E